MNRVTMAIQEILDGEAEALTRKAVELAKAGNLVALRLCLERLSPPRKDRPVSIRLPAMKTTADIVKVSAAIIREVAGGRLTPGEGEALARIVEMHRRTLEQEVIEKRIAALEAREVNK